MFMFLNLMSRLDIPHTFCIHVCVLVVSIILCDGPELFVKARLIRMFGGPLGRLDLLRHKCGSVGRS